MSQAARAAEEMNAKTGGWGQSGRLIQGNARVVSAQFPLAQVAAEYTVQIDMDAPPGTEAQAKVVFSVRGQTDVTRQMSVGQGVSVTGVADSINVQVRDYTTTAYITPKTTSYPDPITGLPITVTQGSPYSVSISIAPGTRGPTQVWGPTLLPLSPTNQPIAEQTLYYVGSVDNPSGTLVVPIPQGVGVTSYLVLCNTRSSANPTPLASVQQMVSEPTGGPYSVATSQPNNGWTPIVNGANELLITNLQPGSVNQYCTVIFGIDG
jgi:hypothetical protein